MASATKAKAGGKKTLTRGQRLAYVIDRLLASTRGQIFLVNALRALPLLKPSALGDALSSVDSAVVKGMTEGSFLEYLRGILQDRVYGLHLANERRVFPEFSPDGWIVNICTYSAFRYHYMNVPASISGHASLRPIAPGDLISSVESNSRTRDYFWAAPCMDSNPPHAIKNNAERARNLIGLVHYGLDQELIALAFQVNAPILYRPTIVEANPNSRFRQIDPEHPFEDRWGRTVDLEMLASIPTPKDIGGVREILSGGIRIGDALQLECRYLGQTESDQSTTTTDKAFLEHLLGVENIIDVADKILKVLSKP